MGIVFLDFFKAFVTVCHCLEKWMYCGLDKRSMQWVGHWHPKGDGKYLLFKLTACHKWGPQK